MCRELYAGLLALLCAGFAVAPASAQRVAVRLSGSQSRVVVLDPSTGQSRDVSDDEAQVDAVFTSDGRYAVEAATGTIRVRDMASGVVTTLPLDFRPSVPHPRRPMLFGFTGVFQLARLDQRGLVRWAPCAGVATVAAFDVSADGAELFVGCFDGSLVVVDTETGQVRRTLSTPLTAVRTVVVRPDGEVVIAGSLNAGTTAARLDGQSGAVLASRTGLPTWSPTGSRHQLLESNCQVTSCVYQLVDTLTLAVSRRMPGATPFFARVFVSPDGREAVFNDAGFAYADSRATWLDIATGQVLGEIVMPPADRITVNVQYPSLPPVLGAASVTPAGVTLSWQLPLTSPAAATYRLEAGLVPGATAVFLDLGAATSTTIPAVPPGRYYVRIRAVNYNGVSAPSNEVVIDVP